MNNKTQGFWTEYRFAFTEHLKNELLASGGRTLVLVKSTYDVKNYLRRVSNSDIRGNIYSGETYGVLSGPQQHITHVFSTFLERLPDLWGRSSTYTSVYVVGAFSNVNSSQALYTAKTLQTLIDIGRVQRVEYVL